MSTHTAPQLRRIPLADLLPRSDQPNIVLPRVRKSLAAQISETGLYPPLIVRPLKRRKKFEILDGRQRADILAELGHRDARCELWRVNDHQADALAATLNHLRGRPNAKLLAEQIRGLICRLGHDGTGALLALPPAGIRQRLMALKPPTEVSHSSPGLDLRPVTFHLSPADLELLQQKLRSATTGRGKRAEQLMEIIKAAGSAALVKEDQDVRSHQ